MEESQAQSVAGKLSELKSRYQVEIAADWGYDDSGGTKSWRPGNWTIKEVEGVRQYVELVAEVMGGAENFIRNLGGVAVKKSDLGSHAGEALPHQVLLAAKGQFTAWTFLHELAHAWDGNYHWNLSRALRSYTGGFTSPLLSRIIKFFGLWDGGPNGEGKEPGTHCRKPGCNAAGYFYGDKPSGSNFMFNHVEDFAESVVMYIGWQPKERVISARAKARVSRYTLENGAVDKVVSGIADNWRDYAKYFYPDGGDYTKTKRWQFVDDLVKGKIKPL